MKISVSSLRLFKACRRAYELRYIEKLVPVQTADALVIGSNYHSKLESLYNGAEIDTDFSKETAMALAYKKHIFPAVPKATPEAWFEMPLSEDDVFVGRIDGITHDGRLLEHKTTSAEITEAYEYGLMWDEQIPAYMYAIGTRQVYYTVCRKPTIKQKQNEPDDEFFQRMCDWYETDTDSKVRMLEIYRTDAEVAEFVDELKRMTEEIKTTKNFYRNPAYCMNYGRRCEYAPVCLHYDPTQDYVEFRKEERYADTQNVGD